MDTSENLNFSSKYSIDPWAGKDNGYNHCKNSSQFQTVFLKKNK